MVLDSSIHARRQRGKRWNRIYSDGARGAGSLRGALTGNDARSASIIARFRGVPAPGGWRPSAANISVGLQEESATGFGRKAGADSITYQLEKTCINDFRANRSAVSHR
jgi:hypothetical protein